MGISILLSIYVGERQAVQSPYQPGVAQLSTDG